MLRLDVAWNLSRPAKNSLKCQHASGRSLKIGLGELPPVARFFQVRLFELRHDLTRAPHARPNDGGLTAQMGNCSDISFAIQHYPTHEVAC